MTLGHEALQSVGEGGIPVENLEVAVLDRTESPPQVPAPSPEEEIAPLSLILGSEPPRRPRILIRGTADLRDRERVRRHLHVQGPAPAVARRGRPLPLPPGRLLGAVSNVFLENGARLYLDVGSHPEYATPECDTVYDLVVHDKAGERILEGLLKAAEARLREEGISGDIYLFKNNTDSAGNSYGSHENYLVSRYGEFGRLAEVMIPFFVTRQIFAGAGKVLQTARGALFCISQRAEHIWEGVSSATTRSRPIINTRDEPHADAEKYRRLHVIVGDSNMNEWTSYLKVGTTALLLRMVEEGVQIRDMTLENPIRAIREISHDMTCTRRVRLANGREASALDMQKEYLTRRSGGSTSGTTPSSRRSPSCGSTPSPPSRTTRTLSSHRWTGSPSESSSRTTGGGTTCRSPTHASR